MAYIGRGLDKLSNVDVLNTFSFTDSAGPYNITKGSPAVAFIPSAVQNLLIEVDGVIQASASYTITGSTITFGVSMSSSSTMNSFIHFGMGVTMTPADGTVSTIKVVDDAVTTAKILDNNVTVAKLPTTLDISGNTVTLPASVSGLGTGITNAQLAGSIDVTSKITGVVPSANLGSGTGSSANFLRGDSSWQEVATGTSWQTVVTASTLTAVAGNGYPINTTSNACTVTLPAGSVGDTIEIVDYAGTFDTNKVTLTTTEKIKGSDDDGFLQIERQGVKLVYVDATQGWEVITGVNETAPAIKPPAASLEFLVVAGGAGGGSSASCTNPSGGGGAGGHRTSTQTIGTGTVITVTVGNGGAGGTGGARGTDGNASSVSGGAMTTISSAGGGYGAFGCDSEDGGDGGSGGGGATNLGAGGSGNTPSVSPVQGYDGGVGYAWTYNDAGGGGGAAAVGADATSTAGGAGGIGAITTIMTTTMATNNSVGQVDGSDVYFAGGGGGACHLAGPGNPGAGGKGGGGAGGDGIAGVNATVNSGGGGGGAAGAGGYDGGDGGKGCVALKVLTADYSSTSTGSPDADTDGSYTILTFTATGSYTV